MTGHSDGATRLRWDAFADNLGPSMFVAILLPDGRVLHANAASLRAFGTTAAEVRGVPVEQLRWLQGRDDLRRQVAAALAAGRRGEASRFEFSFVTPAGATTMLDFSLSPVPGEDGRPAVLVASACDVTARHRAEQQAAYLREHDPLTGLPNSHWLCRVFGLREAGEERPASVLYLNVDRFSRVNRALGRSAADRVLQALAARMRDCVGDGAALVRMDGDEFVVVLEGLRASLAEASGLARDLLLGLSRPLPLGVHELSVTASIGIASGFVGSTGIYRLLRDAAVALGRAKAKGRNACEIHEGDADDDPESLALEGALRHAVQRDELRLHYQPRVALATGEIVGVEALLRWENPVHGQVSPARFIPVAEEAGLICDIGDWVLHTACATAAGWQREGLPPVRMMVNVSAQQLLAGDLVERVQRALANTGLEPARLGLEITESILMSQLDGAAAQLARLRGIGVEIALDDFGTGYSSLSYLRRLPLDVVKIDRSLIPAVSGDTDALPIVRAIIAMASSLGLRVVAEGVENAGQLELLRANGCEEFQGYHFSRPLEAENVREMLRNGRRHDAGDVHALFVEGGADMLVLPSQLLTMPGDLWVEGQAPGPRRIRSA